MLNKIEINYAPDHGSSGIPELPPGASPLTPELESKIRIDLGEKWIQPSQLIARFTRSQLQRNGQPLSAEDESTVLRDLYVFTRIKNKSTTLKEFKQIEEFWKHEGIYPASTSDSTYRPSYYQSANYYRYARGLRQ